MATIPQTRVIAIYLPQYHPIPENDRWWGPGFTEWRPTTSAKPLYRGHEQPKLPGELGFYDLRIHSVMSAQAQLAASFSIDGFMFWHYWFGGGRRILEMPVQKYIDAGEPGFPFMLGWANESWTRIWYSPRPEVLLEQSYPGPEDYRTHLRTLLPAFIDPRYIRIGGSPVFMVYRPRSIPDPRVFADVWRQEAVRLGLPGVHLVSGDAECRHSDIGFDSTYVQPELASKSIARTDRLLSASIIRRQFLRTGPLRVRYASVHRKYMEDLQHVAGGSWPGLVPNWDNTPRRGRRGLVVEGSSPERFRMHVREVAKWSMDRGESEKLVFLKSWNEWAEGNYVEPDLRHARGWLEGLKRGLADAVSP